MNDTSAEAPPIGQPMDQGVQAILSNIADKLRTRKGGDLALTAILVKHVLTAAPAKATVEEAAAAILALATARATVPPATPAAMPAGAGPAPQDG
jgi:hypothetical protein